MQKWIESSSKFPDGPKLHQLNSCCILSEASSSYKIRRLFLYKNVNGHLLPCTIHLQCVLLSTTDMTMLGASGILTLFVYLAEFCCVVKALQAIVRCMLPVAKVRTCLVPVTHGASNTIAYRFSSPSDRQK